MNHIKAYPGCYIVKALEEHLQPNEINYGQKDEKNQRILKAEVVDIGAACETKYGGHLEPYKEIAVGDILYFLSYEGGYDKIGDKLYAVIFDDARGYEKGTEE